MAIYFRITPITQKFLVTKAVDTHYISHQTQNARGLGRMLTDWPTVSWIVVDASSLFRIPVGRYHGLTIYFEAQQQYQELARVLGFPQDDPFDAVSCFLNSAAAGAIVPTGAWPSPFVQSEYAPRIPAEVYTRIPGDETVIQGIYLSDKAQLYFQQMASISGFAKDDTKWRRRPIGKYVEALSLGAFSDVRPSAVKATDDLMRQLGRRLIWSEESDRHLLYVELYDSTIQSLLEAARLFDISPPSKRTAVSFASAVLEAIGIGWLAPFAQPAKQRTA